MDTSQYFEDTYRNARIMQMTLRELDSDTLAMALAGLSAEHREWAYRNLTQATAKLIAEGVQRNESEASEAQVRAAVEFLHDILGKIVAEVGDAISEPPPPVEVRVRVSTKQELEHTLVALAQLAKGHGLLALEKVDAAADPLLAKGLQMVADGHDPALLDSILERTKRSLLQDLEERLSMIIEGVESIQFGDHPTVIAEKLSAYQAG